MELDTCKRRRLLRAAWAIAVAMVGLSCCLAQSQERGKTAIEAWTIKQGTFHPGYYYWPAFGQKPSEARYCRTWDEFNALNIQITGVPHAGGTATVQNAIPAWMVARQGFHPGYYYWPGYKQKPSDATYLRTWDEFHKMDCQITGVPDNSGASPETGNTPGHNDAGAKPTRFTPIPENVWSFLYSHGSIIICLLVSLIGVCVLLLYCFWSAASFPQRAAAFSLLAPYLSLSLIFCPAFIPGIIFGIAAMVASKRDYDEDGFITAMRGTCACGLLALFVLVGWLQHIGISDTNTNGVLKWVLRGVYIAILLGIFYHGLLLFRSFPWSLIKLMILPFQLLKCLITGGTLSWVPFYTSWYSRSYDSQGRNFPDPHYGHGHSRSQDPNCSKPRC